MMSYEKKYPALEDTDKITFGKFKGTPLQDVPASYLLWLYENTDARLTHEKLYNYIHNSMDAIKMELGIK